MSKIVIVGAGVVGTATGVGLAQQGHDVSFVDVDARRIDELRAGGDLGRNEHNGEGVYIGTDPHQLDRNPTAVPDASNDNVVRANAIATYGAECVDIKEAAEHNRVLDNVCSHSRDPKGSGLDTRGNHNVFRGNVVSANAGAGIRFGGYGANDGVENTAVGNVLVANRGYGLLVLRVPQARLCGNVVRQSGAGVVNVQGLHPEARC